MEVHQFIADFSELRKEVTSCVVLFSGDFYSSYFLLWAQKHGIRTVAVQVHLGFEEPPALIEGRAVQLGSSFESYNATGFFVEDFIKPAIRTGALHPGSPPLWYPLAQPLRAEALLKTARKEAVECIVHPTVFSRSSADSFANTVRALAPNIRVANPFVSDPIRIDYWRRELLEAGIDVGDGDVKVANGNIWGRVVNKSTVATEFAKLGTKPLESPTQDTETSLEFENGVPVSLDGQVLPLREIILRLTSLGERYGVGQFRDFVEDSRCAENQTFIQAPAAEIILTAHAALERSLLTEREHRVKNVAGWEWGQLVTEGSWYSPLREALSAHITSINRLLCGKVSLTITPGRVLVSGVHSPLRLDLLGPEGLIRREVGELRCHTHSDNLESLIQLRASCWQPTKTILSLRVEDLP